MSRHCFAMDLKNDPEVIAQYKNWHAPHSVPAAVCRTFARAGIHSLEIYCVSNRLFMIIEAEADFRLGTVIASHSDAGEVQAWDTLMRHFQQPIPTAGGGTWIELDSLYRFEV